MHLVWCQLRPEEIGHDERRADREEVFWREPCERVTHALPDLPAWPVRIGGGRRGQQSERPGGEHEEEAVPRALVGTLRGQPADVADLKLISFPFSLPFTGQISPPALPAGCVPRPAVLETACAISSAALSLSVRLRALLHVEYLGEAVLPLPPGVGLRGEGGHEGAHTWLGLGLGLGLGC